MNNRSDTGNPQRSVLIVGGLGVLGLALVDIFIASGCYRVAVTARDSNIKARSDFQILERKYPDAEIVMIPLDLSKAETITKACSEFRTWSRGTRASLVLAAGAPFGAHGLMTQISDLKSVFDINYFGVIQVIQRLAKQMIRDKQGEIVTVLSVQACIAQPGNLAYGGSKAALAHSTKIFAAELAPFGISVNAVAPTAFDSPMADSMDESSLNRLLELSSVKSKVKVRDVANYIFFVVDSSSKHVTGQILRVDGGIL